MDRFPKVKVDADEYVQGIVKEITELIKNRLSDRRDIRISKEMEPAEKKSLIDKYEADCSYPPKSGELVSIIVSEVINFISNCFSSKHSGSTEEVTFEDIGLFSNIKTKESYINHFLDSANKNVVKILPYLLTAFLINVKDVIYGSKIYQEHYRYPGEASDPRLELLANGYIGQSKDDYSKCYVNFEDHKSDYAKSIASLFSLEEWRKHCQSGRPTTKNGKASFLEKMIQRARLAHMLFDICTSVCEEYSEVDIGFSRTLFARHVCYPKEFLAMRSGMELIDIGSEIINKIDMNDEDIVSAEFSVAAFIHSHKKSTQLRKGTTNLFKGDDDQLDEDYFENKRIEKMYKTVGKLSIMLGIPASDFNDLTDHEDGAVYIRNLYEISKDDTDKGKAALEKMRKEIRRESRSKK